MEINNQFLEKLSNTTDVHLSLTNVGLYVKLAFM